MNNEFSFEGVEEFDLSQYCEEAYLNYALYVIKDRVLPYIGDGLKPVQRRIIYTMALGGINSSEKKKKCAYTVGQVLGRFHPHGDSACYESMVSMVQDFTYRYPLISGQGNFGDLFNPKGFAAMRYTESFLSPYSSSLLSELKSGNVEWTPNYNGDEKEPLYLPARLPNLLLNGTSGIAVGMATDIPPHNVGEVVAATCALIDNPKLSMQEIMEYIPGPDYPNGAEIINSKAELEEIYTTGRGSIRQRAVWHKEKDQIIITELPYQSAPNLIVKIAELIQGKKLPTLEDVRDDSSENETRVVLQLKSARVDPEPLMNMLFVQTDLEKTLRVNLNLIGINRKPGVRSLKEILLEWIEFRKDIVRKRFEHRLEKIGVELNRLAGFIIAFNNLERVIEIVRNDDKPKESLMAEFALNEEQATSILDLRIRNLSRLEEDALRKNEKALLTEQKKINTLLASPKKFNLQIKNELIEAGGEFASGRRSPLVVRQSAKTIEIVEELPNDPVCVVISKHGWIRCGKGHDFDIANLNYRNGDEYLAHCFGYANEAVYFIDSEGQSYSLMAHTLPSMRGHGEALSSRLKIKDSARIVTMLMGKAEQKLLLATSAGKGFITTLGNLDTKNKAGKALINLKDNGELISTLLLPEAYSEETDSDYLLFCLSSAGRGLAFRFSEIPELNKGKGVKLIDIKNDEFAAGKDFLRNTLTIEPGSSLMIKNGKRQASVPATTISKITASRGKRGKVIVKGITAKTEVFIKNKG